MVKQTSHLDFGSDHVFYVHFWIWGPTGTLTVLLQMGASGTESLSKLPIYSLHQHSVGAGRTSEKGHAWSSCRPIFPIYRTQKGEEFPPGSIAHVCRAKEVREGASDWSHFQHTALGPLTRV